MLCSIIPWLNCDLTTMSIKIKPKKVSEAEDGRKEKTEKMTLLSKLTRILIAINLMPVTLDTKRRHAKFSFFSFKSFTYLLISYSPFMVFWATFLLPSDYLAEYLSKYPQIYSSFDMVWLLLFTVGSNIIAPLWMLVAAEALCHMTDVSLSKGRSR